MGGLYFISIDELMGVKVTEANKRGPTPKLQKQIELVAQLPRSKQQFVSQMIDAVIQQAATN